MNYSVITICLNSEKTIANTIASILAQTALPNEYIFVDGGSTDGTLGIIQKFSKELSQKGVLVKVIHQNKPKNTAGIPHAWNLALAEVNSALVFILNSDDWYEDNNLAANVLKEFKKGNVELLVGNTIMYDQDMINRASYKNRPMYTFPFLNPINHPATFVLSSVYKTVGLFDETYYVSADYDFLFRCAKAKKNFRFVNNINVSRLDGGFAVQSKQIARKETFQIAKRHSTFKILPTIAYFLRVILNR